MLRAAPLLLVTIMACAAPPTASTADPSPSHTINFGSLTPHSSIDAAMLLAHGVHNRLADGELATWLPDRASFPFDVDGKTQATDAGSLRTALKQHGGEWSKQTTGQTRCDALTRADLIAGERAFHYLDRLGPRPPRTALIRDLDRLGLGPDDILVNCYPPNTTSPGYTVIATPTSRALKLRSFRN